MTPWDSCLNPPSGGKRSCFHRGSVRPGVLWRPGKRIVWFGSFQLSSSGSTMRHSLDPDASFVMETTEGILGTDIVCTELEWKTTRLYVNACGPSPGASQKTLEGGQSVLGPEASCSYKCEQVLATDIWTVTVREILLVPPVGPGWFCSFRPCWPVGLLPWREPEGKTKGQYWSFLLWDSARF